MCCDLATPPARLEGIKRQASSPWRSSGPRFVVFGTLRRAMEHLRAPHGFVSRLVAYPPAPLSKVLRAPLQERRRAGPDKPRQVRVDVLAALAENLIERF